MAATWIRSIGSIALILGAALLLSTDRRAIRLRVVGAAFALQAGIAVLVLYVPAGRWVLGWAAAGVAALLGYANAGSSFLFGPLMADPLGRSFAFQALPVIVFFSALMSVLYHLGVMPFVVRWLGGAVERVTGISKVESLCAAANIFVGQAESPLVIRPYIAGLAPSQLFLVMTSGMAGVAGTMLAAYASLGVRIDYLLAASFMAAPGGILMAKIVMPDRPFAPDPVVPDVAAVHEERAANVIMAAAQGAQTGVKLAVAVAGMLLAFVALVALANGLLGAVGGWFGVAGLSFQRVLGMIFAPLMTLMNVPWHEAATAGGFLGEKVVLNEFVAFVDLARQQSGLSPLTRAIVTFALCGFANLSSIAIQIAVTGSLAPSQRPLIARLGVRALIAGSLANLMSATLAGLMLAT